MQVLKPDYVAVNERQAEALLDTRVYSIDPHIHSNVSMDVLDPVLTPIYMLGKMREARLTPVLTDHDMFDGNEEIAEYVRSENLADEIVTGVEFTLRPRKMRILGSGKVNDVHTLHINVFQLNRTQYDDLLNIAYIGDLDEFVRYCRISRLPYLLNHIFWTETGEKLNWKVVPLMIKKYFSVIELNAKMTKEQNDLTIELAKELGVSLLAGSDTHIGQPGKAFTFADAADFDEFWWERVVPGQAYLARADLSIIDLLDEVKKYVFDFLLNDVEYIKSKNCYFNMSSIKTIKLVRKIVYSRLRNADVVGRLVRFMIESPKTNNLRHLFGNVIYLNKEKKLIEAISAATIAICQILAYSEDTALQPI